MMSFLQSVVQDLISRVGIENIGQYTIVTPMQRGGIWLQEQLRIAVMQQAQHPVLLPQCVTIDELVSELSDLRADDEIRAIVKLHALYTHFNPNNNLPLDVFYGWGKQLLQDFNSIDMALVDADQLFANSIEAHRLEQLDIDPEVLQRLQLLIGGGDRTFNDERSYRHAYQLLWETLVQIYHAFNDWEREQGIGYSGARLRWVIEHWDRIVVGERRFAFVGFNYLLKGEKRLMRLLQHQSLFYWDYDPAFTTNKDAYRFIEQHIRDGLTNALHDTEPDAATPKAVSVIAASGNNTQAQFVHTYLRNNKGRTAIVMADETILENVVYALPDDVAKQVNITKGYPLKLTQVYAEITQLQDPMLWLDREVLFTDEQTQEEQEMQEDTEGQEGASSYTWQQLLGKEAAYQAHKVLSRIQWLIEHGELDAAKDVKVRRNIVKRVLDTVSLPFHGEPLTQIQLIGVLETRLMDFDNVLVLNVEEGVLPKVNKDMSFIPYYLRKYYGIETNDESSAAYAYNFFRLLRRANDITLMFAQAATGVQQKNMSRFLMQILTHPHYAVTKYRITEGVQVNKNETMIAVNPNWLSDKLQNEKSSQLYLSPSAINTYLQCPRKFYYDYIENVQVAQSPSLIMSNNVLGSLIHAVIRAAYEQIGQHTPARITRQAVQDFLHSDYEQFILQRGYLLLNESEGKHNESFEPYILEQHPLENQVALAHLRNVLQYDSAESYLELLEMEQRHEMRCLVDAALRPVQVVIGGVIDRVDVVEVNNQIIMRVIDYKTGKYDPDKPNENYVRQTMIYCEQLSSTKQSGGEEMPLAPALLYTAHIGAKGYMGESDEVGKGLAFTPYISFDGQSVRDYRSVRETFMSQLRNDLTRLVNDTAMPLCDVKDCLPYCPFHSLCHRPERNW